MISEELLGKLGRELVNSPFLSVMIVNRKYEVVWHNQRFADEFNGGMPIEKNRCFQAAGFGKVHDDCPLQKSIRVCKSIRGFLDFGDRNFLFLTIPLDGEHAAKVHIFLPKEPDGMTEEQPGEPAL
jgi:hypothetical protein